MDGKKLKQKKKKTYAPSVINKTKVGNDLHETRDQIRE